MKRVFGSAHVSCDDSYLFSLVSISLGLGRLVWLGAPGDLEIALRPHVQSPDRPRYALINPRIQLVS